MSEELGAAPAPEPVESAPVKTAPTPPEPKAPAAKEPTSADAVERAFEKLGLTDEDAVAQPKPKAEKEPKQKAGDAEKAEKPQSGQDRDQLGRFKAAEKAEGRAEAAPDDKAPAKTETPAVEVPEALARVSEEAKKAWADAPEALRKDIGERFAQLENGLAQYQRQAQTLRPFAEYAQRHNADLPTMLQRMVAANDQLKSDFPGAVRQLAQQFGHEIVDVAMQILDEPAEQQQPQAPAFDAEKEQMRQRLEALEGEQVRAQNRNFVERFAQERPDFESLEPMIANVLKTFPLQGSPEQRLEMAYRMAKGFEPPAPPNAAPASQPQPVRAQQAAKLSVTGAPGAGSNPARQTRSKTTADAVENALRSVGL